MPGEIADWPLNRGIVGLLAIPRRWWHGKRRLSDDHPLIDTLQRAAIDCESMGLPMSAEHARHLLVVNSIGSLTGEEVRRLKDTLERELASRQFVAFPSERQSLFISPLLGWEQVIARFPDAQEDVEEMNKCFALSRYKAAAFHSLMVAEYGLIALGEYLGTTDPKLGWDATCGELRKLMKAGRGAAPAGVNFDLVEQINARAESMKHAWRNKVNHAAHRLSIEKSGFTESITEEFIIATRSFMRQLADGLP